MANRQSRSPGAIQQFSGQGQIASTPDSVVEQGDVFRALAGLGGNVAGRLKQMADQAALREGELAGLDAGQRAGQGYLDRRASEAAASTANSVPVLAGSIDDHIKAAASRHGEDADTLRLIAGIESNGNPNAKNPTSSAGGLFQFIDSTAGDYGLANRFDPAQASDAAARLLKNNRSVLRRSLGRDPTPAELYLAHQQGAGGASELLANPGARAADIVGIKSVTLNGGRADMTAGEFAGIWLKKAGGRVTPAPAGQPLPRLSATPLALRNDGTVRGAAFDNAATNAYSWRMQQGLSTDLGVAYEQFKDDPAGWATQSAAVRDQYLADGNFDDPHMREIFDKTYAQRTEAYSLDVASRHERKLLAQQEAAVGEGLDAMRSDMERQAFALGANPEADRILGQQSQQMLNAIDAAVEDGVLTPRQAASQREGLAKTIANARVNGVFAALETPAQKEAFATGLLDQWSKGEGPMAGMPFDVVKATSATLFSQARAEQNQLTAASKAEAGRIKGLISDDVASMASSGVGVDTSAADLDPERVRTVLGDEGLAAWQADRDFARQTWEATNGMELETPQELTERLATLEPKPGTEGFADQQVIFATATKRAQEVLKERETDPLGQAHRAGAVTLEPIDTSSAETLNSSLTLRKQQAQAVSDMYGTPVTVFRPSERTAFANGILDNPAILPAFAASVTETFGDLAPKALSELSEAGPELAHAAGITLATGDTSVASDIARVLIGRRDKTMTVKMPTDAKMAAAAARVFGGALGQSDATKGAVASVASMLFQSQANGMGFDPAEVNEPGSAADIAYRRAVDRALGASVVNGVQYGGLAQVNGRQVVAPSFMPAERVQDLVETLGPADLANLPPIATANGIAIRASDLQGANLVTVGDGLYRVALGDPDGFDPQYLTTPDGGFWQLDMEQLDAQRATQTIWDRMRPGLFGVGGAVAGGEFAPSVPGNIDLDKRPVVKNSDGSISTERSFSFEEDGVEVLIPTVAPNGDILSEDDAIALYRRTGQFLGKFDTVDAANGYAEWLHKRQSARYRDGQ